MRLRAKTTFSESACKYTRSAKWASNVNVRHVDLSNCSKFPPTLQQKLWLSMGGISSTKVRHYSTARHCRSLSKLRRNVRIIKFDNSSTPVQHYSTALNCRIHRIVRQRQPLSKGRPVWFRDMHTILNTKFLKFGLQRKEVFYRYISFDGESNVVVPSTIFGRNMTAKNYSLEKFRAVLYLLCLYQHSLRFTKILRLFLYICRNKLQAFLLYTGFGNP